MSEDGWIITEPNAKIICDSVSEDGYRLTTIEATMHRFVLAEFNTHRAFSRNSASSRAIPVHKQTLRVMEDPATPFEFGINQPGMQAEETLSGEDAEKAEAIWTEATMAAVEYATELDNLGVHKQVTNRLLEPFMWHKVIVSSTEWENFFTQRCSPLAQPEMRAAATAIRDAYRLSDPTMLSEDEWHLPYITGDERSLDLQDQIKVSVARCARVSYLTHDGVRDPAEDIALFEKLVSADPPHSSPLEHVARPIPANSLWSPLGNFAYWQQLRHDWVESSTL